jgi:hypothetical protein
MRSGVLVAGLAALAALGPTAWAAEKIDLKVLYAGNPGSARAKDFASFLRRHFTKVGEINYDKFREAEAKGFDVVVFDWTSIYPRDKAGKISPKITRIDTPKAPELSASFDRPAILIGAAGGTLAGRLRLKIDWL